jgi:hypothetical protein
MNEGEAKDIAVEVAAAITNEMAEQRHATALEVRKQRLSLVRQVADAQISFEAVIDETADVAEIYATLARVDNAVDRMKAKADLSGFYAAMLNKCSEIDLAVKRMAEDQVAFDAENAEHNERRKVARTMTSAQRIKMDQNRTAIRECWMRIQEFQKAADECRRILGGEDPFKVLDEQIAVRLDGLRATRGAAAA